MICKRTLAERDGGGRGGIPYKESDIGEILRGAREEAQIANAWGTSWTVVVNYREHRQAVEQIKGRRRDCCRKLGGKEVERVQKKLSAYPIWWFTCGSLPLFPNKREKWQARTTG